MCKVVYMKRKNLVEVVVISIVAIFTLFIGGEEGIDSFSRE